MGLKQDILKSANYLQENVKAYAVEQINGVLDSISRKYNVPRNELHAVPNDKEKILNVYAQKPLSTAAKASLPSKLGEYKIQCKTVGSSAKLQEEFLIEMASAELAKVVDMIKAGDLKGAAAKYIEVGGNPSSSGVGKTVNSYIAKHADLSPEEKQQFESFKSAVEEIKGEKGIKSNRPTEYKTGVTGVTRKGEEVTVKGLSQQARKENVLKVIDKQKIEIDKERAMLDAGNDEAGLRKMAMEFVKDMKYTDLTDEDKDFIATLKDFSATGNNKEKAVDIMHTIIDEGEKVMIALKKRVAAGAMVKPTEQKMLGQMEKYKKIDVLKGQKELEVKAQKQIEQKPANESIAISNKEYLETSAKIAFKEGYMK